jgi:hypothetical protein
MYVSRHVLLLSKAGWLFDDADNNNHARITTGPSAFVHQIRAMHACTLRLLQLQPSGQQLINRHPRRKDRNSFGRNESLAGTLARITASVRPCSDSAPQYDGLPLHKRTLACETASCWASGLRKAIDMRNRRPPSKESRLSNRRRLSKSLGAQVRCGLAS